LVALSLKVYYNDNVNKEGVVEMREYKKILVPVDGSTNSELALKKAIFVAKRNHAHLDILTVIQSSRFMDIYGHMGTNMNYVEVSLLKAKEYVDDLKEQIQRKYDFDDIDVYVKAGEPKSIVAVQMPEELGTDLIMMGSTGLNALQRAMIGSVADYVIRAAEMDVILVKTGIDNLPYSK
jgi:nucleotide-binding universal stress UspA family protein